MKTAGLIALIVLLAALGRAQTNQYYTKGEIVTELAPTISSANLFKGSAPKTYGWSLETEDWETVWTGTGLEMGTYDISKGGLDHTAIMQDFRYPLFSHLAIGMKTGAETYYSNGAKGVELGGEVYWTFGAGYRGIWSVLNNSRIEVDIEQHTASDRMTARVAWQIVF